MKQILRNTPLNVGNALAWVAMAACVGFALGWIVNAERMYGYCMVP